MAVKRLTGKLIDIGLLARNTYLLKIEFEEEVEFIPGQFVSMKVNDEGLRRSYSIASLPKGKEIELLVDIAPMGVGSKYILSLKKGDFMEFLCFLGKFTIDEESLMKDKILFVGTGAGIAPLKPMIEDLLNNKKYTGRVNLIWGMRHEDDLYWQEEFKDIQDRFGNFEFKIVLSKPDTTWVGEKGHVQDLINIKYKKLTNMSAYLCGNPEMIGQVNNILIEKGLEKTEILFERFA